MAALCEGEWVGWRCEIQLPVWTRVGQRKKRGGRKGRGEVTAWRGGVEEVEQGGVCM